MNPRSFQERAAEVGNLLATRPLVRTVNFHNTPRARASEYERQVAQFARQFSPVGEDDLDRYLQTGHWHRPKPGLIVALYEGYRNHYDVMVPILERHGLVAWFFVITGFVNAPVSGQWAFAEQHDITPIPEEYPDGRIALSWQELRALDGRHVLASHARTHTRLSSLDAAAMEGEVIGSQQDFEAGLGRPVRSFVSYAGPAYGEFAPADRLVDRAGYQFVFSNYRIQRLR
ncbi:MAG: polysaccharide deacetylase family protein [Verrucomicrobia bacterium]|nr:polysaccharide deacetylase family protein [Verrucomicrobiota bacterium]